MLKKKEKKGIDNDIIRGRGIRRMIAYDARGWRESKIVKKIDDVIYVHP